MYKETKIQAYYRK